jgi:hypothetical protein
MRRLALFLVALLVAAGCAESQTGRGVHPLPRAAGNPNAACPSGWLRISQQAWVQADRNGDGRVDFPQSLPQGGGGHLHEEFCAPVGQPISGRTTFHMDLMSHQGFQGRGDKVDVGLAPGGSSLGRASAPSMTCGPKPAKCHDHVSVTFDAPGGSENLRVRYLPATLPSGERWFVGGELPVGGGSGDGFGAKSWLDGYANARFRDLSLFNRPLSGTVQVPVYTKGDHITKALVHVDARFGDDSEGRVIAVRDGEFRGNVPLDTTQLTNGWHCLSVRADAGGIGGGRLHTGVIEAPILVDNPGQRVEANGTGSCFDS